MRLVVADVAWVFQTLSSTPHDVPVEPFALAFLGVVGINRRGHREAD